MSSFMQELFHDLHTSVENLSSEQIKRILSFGYAIQEADGKISLPDFPLDSMHALVQVMVSTYFSYGKLFLNFKLIHFLLQSKNPKMVTLSALSRLYPYNQMLPKEGIDSVKNLLQSLNIETDKIAENQRITNIQREDNGCSKGEFMISLIG